ncbi:MAG: right-handed parallel beta-helix repeat-containing protein [Calditrichota bacterium]
MKRLGIGLGGILLAGALSAQAITVTGTALLEGRSDHAGSKAVFTAASPSAQTDSAITDGDGHYNLELAAGVYDIVFSHEEFLSCSLRTQALLSNTTLDSVVLLYFGQTLPELNGSVWGDIGPGEYRVTGSIGIPAGYTLNVAPGTRLLFEGPYVLQVNGVLNAMGTSDDSIRFTRRFPTDASCWQGIFFDETDSEEQEQSHLEYCAVEWSRKTIPGPPEAYGAGILTFNSSPTIAHCLIQNNRNGYGGGGHGGGIACYGGTPIITDCEISNNRVQYFRGGGVYCTGSAARFERCIIRNNIVENGSGGGVATTGFGAFVDCEISENYAWEGGGIYLSGTASTVFSGCVIAGNSATDGAAVYSNSAGRIERCTIAENNASYRASIFLSSSTLVVTSSIIAPPPQDIGIYFSSSSQSVIRYCDIFCDPQYRLWFAGNNPSNGPAAIGILAVTNANGDSSDTYYNIFSDPEFVDREGGDYHLTADSPCIDAGDPNLGLDPDLTVADIGAFYYSSMTTQPNTPIVAVEYGLLDNYPNPFNPTTEIIFSLPRAAHATLSVYDVLGRQVALLENGWLPAGQYRRSFDGSAFASGVYFCILQADGLQRSRKMVLMK